MVRMLERYVNDVRPALEQALGRSNVHDLPRLEKICLNMGVGAAIQEAKLLEDAAEQLTLIAGQRAVVTRAKKSVSNFKLRAGYRIGCRVTLRRARMWEFFDRLVSIALPMVRDFRGVSPRGFDQAGNYSLGLEEQTIFPEIDPDSIGAPQGMDVTFVIRGTHGAEDSREFLRLMGMPFQQRESSGEQQSRGGA